MIEDVAARPREVGISAADLAARWAAVRGGVLDPAQAPSAARLRDAVSLTEREGEALVASATIYREATGGSLRTFSGGLAHENGWYPSFKRQRLLPWQGEAQLNYVERNEADGDVVWSQTESKRFEFDIDGRRSTTIDVEEVRHDGSITMVELKRGERDLRDDDLLRNYACAAEICRRVGWRYRIVFEPDIFYNRYHRDNSFLFASRRFATVGLHHLDRLRRHKQTAGSETTYADLAEALDPKHPVRGAAALQALVVRRRLRIDLKQRLRDATPVVIV